MHKIDNSCAELHAKLKIDCEKCSGLCCVALYCAKSDGFPSNKDAGVPCKHLDSNFHCDIHTKLISKNMRGCFAYDCFGAGQKVTQKYASGTNWKSDPSRATEIFQVFLMVFHLHQMEYYLIEALSLTFDEPLKSNIRDLIAENEQITAQHPHQILKSDTVKYAHKVNRILKEVIEGSSSGHADNNKTKYCIGKDFKKANLDGRDFSMALMISANLEGCNLHRTSFLGADMRDVNIKNTDLSQTIFLTQMQINSANGNSNTKLPKHLSTPASWQRL